MNIPQERFTGIISIAILGVVIVLIMLFTFKRIIRKNTKISSDDKLSFIDYTLNVAGYRLTPYGVGISLLSLNQGFSKEETFSHVAMLSLAQHVTRAENDSAELARINASGLSITNNLNRMFKNGLIRAEIYENDFDAIISVSTLNEEQEQCVADMLNNNELSNKDIIALPIKKKRRLKQWINTLQKE